MASKAAHQAVKRRIEREAFRAGFRALLASGFPKKGREHVWTFDDFSVAADLEPEAYEAWQALRDKQ